MEAARREAEGHWKAGDACMRKGEYDTAERAYSEALKLWPEAQEARGGR
jgi:cytochrome c-type biogenesis protein CcmH/NrfG